MKKTVLRAYARLIAEVGARVQKGQDVVIEAELEVRLERLAARGMTRDEALARIAVQAPD